MSFFGFDQSNYLQDQSVRPFWTCLGEQDDNEKILEWLNQAYEIESNASQDIRQKAHRNMLAYKGEYDRNRGGLFAESLQPGSPYSTMQKTQKMVVNHLYDLTEQRVSRMTRYKPAIQVNPANSEYQDKISAKVVKAWVDYEFYVNDVDRLVIDVARTCYVMGEGYILPKWNPNKGDLHPAWKKEVEAARREGRSPRLPRLDNDGNEIVGDDGEVLYVERPIFTGDIEFELLTPLNVHPQSVKHKWCDVEYVFIDRWMDIDEVRMKYPHAADELGTNKILDEMKGTLIHVKEFYHRQNEFMSCGRRILFTSTVILEDGYIPDTITDLPLVRLSDIDIPNELRAMSFYQNGYSINAAINDFTTMVRRNTMWAAHPKWVIPRGSLVKKEPLGNDIAMIEFSGPVPPRIEMPPPLSGELFSVRKELKQDLQQIMGVFDISRGQVPPNVRSGIAMQYLDEQENERANASVAKHAALIRELVQKSILLAAAYYDKDDERLIRIMGSNNKYIVANFDPEHLSKAYDIRVQNSSALPQSRAARTQTIIELKQAFPQLVKDEQVADMLQFGDTEKYYDATTMALRSAEAENEDLLSGKDVADPTEYEDHVTHWTIHTRDMQNRGYKESPLIIQQRYIDHVTATEMLMLRQIRKNPAYATQLVSLPRFPMFFSLGLPDMIALDRARSGQPLSLVELQSLYNAEDSLATQTNPNAVPGLGMGPPQPQQTIPAELQGLAQNMPSGQVLPGADMTQGFAAPAGTVGAPPPPVQTPGSGVNVFNEDGPDPIMLPAELSSSDKLR